MLPPVLSTPRSYSRSKRESQAAPTGGVQSLEAATQIIRAFHLPKWHRNSSVAAAAETHRSTVGAGQNLEDAGPANRQPRLSTSGPNARAPRTKALTVDPIMPVPPGSQPGSQPGSPQGTGDLGHLRPPPSPSSKAVHRKVSKIRAPEEDETLTRTKSEGDNRSLHDILSPTFARARTSTITVERRLSGLVPWCHSCRALFNQEAARYCLHCGEQRLERCHFGTVFHLLVGDRTLLRKMDLSKVNRQTNDLLQAIPRQTSQSFRSISACTQSAFAAVMEDQSHGGVQSSQGITLDYFQDFLFKVSRSLDLSLPSLLFGLLEQMQVSRVPSIKSSSDASASQEAASLERVSSIDTVDGVPVRGADICGKCGSKFLSMAKFCCICGERQPDPPAKVDKNAFHIFKGTSRWLAEGVQPAIGVSQHDFEQVVSLAKVHHLPMDEVRRRQIEFQTLNKDGSGTLSASEFTDAVRRYCNIMPNEEVPEHLFDRAWFGDDGDTNSGMDFESFLRWTCRVSSTEEMLVTDPEERRLRQLARGKHVDITAVDKAKRLFDRFGCNGRIHEDKFRNLLAACMDIKDPEDIPSQTAHRCWMDANVHNAAHVSFEQFFVYWLEHFAE
mmetsp:Transcript_55292/g.128709  ORF Transcript_55292/g.128709 Transcript_55292/m.128709 type:complete len:614 (-) Transcript_55292:461-2302(-)